MLPYTKRPLTPDTSSSASRPSRSVRFKPDLVERKIYNPLRGLQGRGAAVEGLEDETDDEDDGEDDGDSQDECHQGREETREDKRLAGGMTGERKRRRDTVLCLHGPNGANLSAACYDPSAKKLHVLEDTKDTVSWDLAVLVMEQYNPHMIIMSSRTQDSLVDKIDEYCLQNGITAEIRPSKKSDRADAINHLSNLRLAGLGSSLVEMPSDHRSSSGTATVLEDAYDPMAKYTAEDEEHAGMGRVRLGMVKLGCWVNVDAPLAVECIGGLLIYVRQVIMQETLPGEEVDVEVDTIESMQLDQHMYINHDALTSLNIFEDDRHSTLSRDKQKEVVSIFSLLRTTVTPLGSKLLRMWHLRPLIEKERIKARHDAVAAFTHTDNRDIATSITQALRKVKNMPSHVRRISKGAGGLREWRALVEALIAAIGVRESMMSMPAAKNLGIGVKAKRLILPRIDFDASNVEKRVCVRPGVDDILDELRRAYDGLGDILEAVAQKVKGTIDPQYPVDLNVVYFGQIGFLVSVELLEEGFQAPRDWKVMFSSESVWYFKTKQIRMLDDEYGDIETLIAGREIAIIQELVESTQGLEKELSHAMDIMAELDCLLALARAADLYSLVRPTLVDEPILEIRRGRNILQEHWVQTYIANDTMMAGGIDSEFDSMMIVTGANGSGKSAYGRQVALITFLAQIGSFVPAESAVIGIVDKIFTRMQTIESSSKNASAFMIDLAQVSLALRGATTRSLVILDEFGKGTTPADGAGLLAGVIEHLLNGPCPRTIILTHFHELFTQHFIDDQLPIIHCHMKTELVEDSKELVYLYRLTPGKSLSSNAAECALANGIPRKIVERAKVVSGHIARFEISKIHERQLTPEAIYELEQCEDLARRFLEWDIDEKNEDVMDVLRNMLKEALGKEDGSSEGGQDDEGQEPKLSVQEIIEEGGGAEQGVPEKATSEMLSD